MARVLSWLAKNSPYGVSCQCFSIHCPLTFLLGYKFSAVFTLTLNSIFHSYCNKPRTLVIHLTRLSQHLSGVFLCFSGQTCCAGSEIHTVSSNKISYLIPLCAVVHEFVDPAAMEGWSAFKLLSQCPLLG